MREGAKTRMMAAMVDSPVRRRVEKVPALLVAMMTDAGKLPVCPRPPSDTLGFRVPTLAELAALNWICVWEHDSVVDERGIRSAVGVASFRDVYDWHSASDVREIVSIMGTPRAIVDLVRWLRFDASIFGRRCIGTFDRKNSGLGKMLEGLGCKAKRVTFEDLPHE